MPSRVLKSWSNGILISEVEAFAAKFPECLVIQPRRLAGESREGLGVHRVSLPQAAMELARPALAERGLAPLSTLGLEALAARVVHRARRDGRLDYFNPVAGLPGFARALARTLRDLRLAAVSHSKLDGDLAGLLEIYEEELRAGSLADLASVLALACEVSNHRWLGLPLACLDPAFESASHQRLFDHLASRSPEVLTAILGPVEVAAAATSTLEHLRQSLFDPAAKPLAEPDGSFDYFSAPGEALECVEIARRIQKLAREGVTFDQVAILLRNPERYQPMVEDALRRAAIPAYFSRGTRRPDPAGRAFLSLLLCAAENFSASRFAEYLSLGQVPDTLKPAEWVSPDDELLVRANGDAPVEADPPKEPQRATPWRWEQLLVDAAVIGGKDRWQRRLDGLEAEWKLQEVAGDRLERLRNLREFALPLIGALDALPRSAAWGEWLESLSDLARRSLRAPENVLAVLAELAPMAEVGPAALDEVIEVLSERLRFLRREPPARRWGRVFAGSLDEARGREFAVVFVPGLAEGLFPQRPSEDPLLLDEIRKALDAALPLRTQRVDDERLRLRLAVAAARDRLITSYPRMDVAEARPRVPSFYALELPRALAGSIPELAAFERHAREAAPARLNWPAPREAADAIDDAEFDLVSLAAARRQPGAAHYLVEANSHLARALRARWYRWHAKWWAADGLITSNRDALAALAGQRLEARAWSASSLENFAVCPYKFALRAIYRLAPREDAAPLQQLDPLTRGSLFHAVQFELFNELRDAGLLPVTQEKLLSALSRAEQVLKRVSAEFAEKLAPAIERVWESEIDDLRTDLLGWLNYVAANESDWVPVHFEYEFDLAANESRPAALKGRIDLIERHSTRPVLRVTDHKTGKRPDTVPRWVGGGRHLQPLLYAMAVEQSLGQTVEAGRLLYATQRGGYVPFEIALDDRARQVVGNLLSRIDASIENGFLPPAPEKEACGNCDYRIVCGPYEERRLLRKDRRDERLEALVEIRGMA